MPKIAAEIYIGLDPGASGGLAAIALDGVESIAMPQTLRDIWDWIRFYGSISREWRNDVFAVIEKVGGYVGDGGNPGSAMFKFGANYGALKAFLTAAEIPFEEITPGVWQKALGIPKRDKKESRTQWKNRLKNKAQQLFPSRPSITLKTADALLISEYCRRKRLGLLGAKDA